MQFNKFDIGIQLRNMNITLKRVNVSITPKVFSCLLVISTP